MMLPCRLWADGNKSFMDTYPGAEMKFTSRFGLPLGRLGPSQIIYASIDGTANSLGGNSPTFAPPAEKRQC